MIGTFPVEFGATEREFSDIVDNFFEDLNSYSIPSWLSNLCVMAIIDCTLKDTSGAPFSDPNVRFGDKEDGFTGYLAANVIAGYTTADFVLECSNGV